LHGLFWASESLCQKSDCSMFVVSLEQAWSCKFFWKKCLSKVTQPKIVIFTHFCPFLQKKPIFAVWDAKQILISIRLPNSEPGHSN
jgi:hypothetical protein